MGTVKNGRRRFTDLMKTAGNWQSQTRKPFAIAKTKEEKKMQNSRLKDIPE
jgi:hypothetical protein